MAEKELCVRCGQPFTLFAGRGHNLWDCIAALQHALAAERERAREAEDAILGAYVRAMPTSGICPFCDDAQGHEPECIMWTIPDGDIDAYNAGLVPAQEG